MTDTINDHDEPTTNQAETYHSLMTAGYTIFLPAVLAVVMFITLVLLGANIFVNLVISLFTYLGVLGIAKTFFVH
ncbi:MAG: hypothetical protein AAF511_02630 [Pseudomonadota bacterium]